MIHPTAIVESGAQLGADVKIGPYAFVGAKARLGDGCVLAPHAVVLDYATLGARCRVHSGAVVGDLPQDLSFQEAETFVIAGDDCVFREGVTVHRGTKPGSVTRLGNHVYTMANSTWRITARLEIMLSWRTARFWRAMSRWASVAFLAAARRFTNFAMWGGWP